MLHSRRDPLRDIHTPPSDAHAGMWLDKFMPFQVRQGEQLPSDREEPRGGLVAQVARIAQPDAYKEFYERHWKPALAAADAKCRVAHVQGRLAIGLGAEAVLETAITLHHTYGVPYIPGSALKGLAASYAHRRLEDDTWRKGGAAHEIMFGSTTEAGYVTFFDAMYVPESGFCNEKRQPQALWPDVITVHHPDYYQGRPDSPPADWDSPTPVAFLSATGDYLIALKGDSSWVEKAFEILTVEAAVHGDRNAAYQALLAHPLGPSADRVQAVLDDLLETHKAHLPQFWM